MSNREVEETKDHRLKPDELIQQAKRSIYNGGLNKTRNECVSPFESFAGLDNFSRLNMGDLEIF